MTAAPVVCSVEMDGCSQSDKLANLRNPYTRRPQKMLTISSHYYRTFLKTDSCENEFCQIMVAAEMHALNM